MLRSHCPTAIRDCKFLRHVRVTCILSLALPSHARLVLVVARTSLAQDIVNSKPLPPDVLEDVCTGNDFGGAGLRKRLPGVSSLDLGELIIAFAQQGDCLQKNAGALNGGRGGRYWEGGWAGFDDGVSIVSWPWILQFVRVAS